MNYCLIICISLLTFLQTESFHEELLIWAACPMTKKVNFQDIKTVVIDCKICDNIAFHTTSDFITAMANDRLPKEKCYEVFEGIKKFERYTMWAQTIIEHLKESEANEALKYPTEVSSISSTDEGDEKLIFNENSDNPGPDDSSQAIMKEVTKILSNPENIKNPQHKLRKRIQPKVEESKKEAYKLHVFDKKSECVMYRLAKDKTHKLKKLAQLYQENWKDITENFIICTQAFYVALLEIIRDIFPDSVKNKLHKLIKELEDEIEKLAVDPSDSNRKKTMQFLAGAMRTTGEIVREFEKPSGYVSKILKSFCYGNSVKMISFSSEILSCFIELLNALGETSCGPGVIEILENQQKKMQEALEFYKSLPDKIFTDGGAVITVLFSLAAGGCCIFGAPVLLTGGTVLGAVALTGGAVLGATAVGISKYKKCGKNWMANSIESYKCEGKKEFDKTLGKSPLPTHFKNSSPKDI